MERAVIHPQEEQGIRFQVEHLIKLKTLIDLSINNAKGLISLDMDENSTVEAEFQSLRPKLLTIIGYKNYETIFGKPDQEPEEDKKEAIADNDKTKLERLYNKVADQYKQQCNMEQAMVDLGVTLNQIMNIKCKVDDIYSTQQPPQNNNDDDHYKDCQKIINKQNVWKWQDDMSIEIKHPVYLYQIKVKYTGETLNNEANGFGIATYIEDNDPKHDDSFTMYGTFSNNQPHGDILIMEGDGWKRFRQYQNGIREGNSRCYYDNGLMNAYWKCNDDYIEGYGVQFYDDGDVEYKGYRHQGNLHGQGVYYNFDRNYFEGEFDRDRMSEGVFTNKLSNQKYYRKYDVDSDNQNNIILIYQKPVEEYEIK